MFKKSRFQQLAGILRESKETPAIKEGNRKDPYDDWEQTQTAYMYKQKGYSEETQRRGAILVHSLLNVADEIYSLHNMIRNLIEEVEGDIEAGVPGAQKFKKKLVKILVNKKLIGVATNISEINDEFKP